MNLGGTVDTTTTELQTDLTTTTREDARWLMALLGPEALTHLSAPMTAEWSARVDDILAAHGGDPVAALDAQHLPADVQATMRRVVTVVG